VSDDPTEGERGDRLVKDKAQHIGEPKESEGKLSGPLRDQAKVDPLITKQSQHEKKYPSEDLEADNDQLEDNGDIFHRI
jgi:hypothetical protein